MEHTSALLNVENCEHFSIRGFVAKVRKKDTSICWPFPGQERTEVLPPIHVPKFKYWKCANCVKNAEKENLGENVEAPNHKSWLLPHGACSHQNVPVPPPGVVELSILHSQPSPKERASKGRLATSSAPVYVFDVDNKPSLDTEIQDDSQCLHTANEFEKKTLVCSDIQDGSQQASGDKAFKSKTANGFVDIYPDKDRNIKSVCHHVEGNVTEVRKGNDVAAIESKELKGLEANAARNVNQDTCPYKGHDGEDKEILIKDCKTRKPRTKQLSPSKSNLRGTEKHAAKSLSDRGSHQGTDYNSSNNEAVNAVTPPKCTERNNQTLDIGHLLGHSPGTTGKRKQIKVRTLGNIISRCGEKEAGSSSSGSDASLGIDLNLSPTHQVVKTKKRKDMGDEEKEYMEISSQKPLLVIVESSYEEEQQDTIGNDQTVSSCSKNVEIGKEDSSFVIFLDETTPSVQKGNEHALLHINGTQSLDATTPMAGVEVIQKREEIVNGKFPLLLPENLTKRPNILKKPSGPIGSRASEQQRNRASDGKGNAALEHTGVDDIPMDIVELMAKHQHERRLSSGENSIYLSGTNTDKVRDSMKTNRKESPGHENLQFPQRSKFPKNKLQYSNEGSSSTGAKRLRLEDLAPSNAYASQNGSRNRGFNFEPEQSSISKGFTAFSEYQERSFRGTQFPADISSRNCGNQSVTCSKNQETSASQAEIFIGCPSRVVGHENSTFSLNKEKPSSEDQFLVGASCSIRDGSYQKNSFLRNQEKTLPGYQFFVCSSKTSSGNRRSEATRTESLSNNPTDFFVGRMHPQSCSQNSEAYNTSQRISWQSSDQHSRSSVRPTCFPPQNSKPQKSAGESSTPHKKPHCLQLFPESNMNGSLSSESTDRFRNHCDNRNWGLDLGTTMGTHSDPAFGDKGKDIPSDLNSVRPVDLYNKESIAATHLLRLMDAGLCPSRPVNADNSQKFSQKSNMCHDHRQFEMSRFGHFQNDDRLLLPSTANGFNRNHHPGSSNEKLASVPEDNTGSVSVPVLVANICCSAAPVPEVNSVCTPPQISGIFKMDSRINSFRDQMKGKGKGKVQVAPTQHNSSRSNTSLSENCHSGKNQELAPIRVLGTAGAMPSPSETLALKVKEVPTQTKSLRSNISLSEYCSSGKNQELPPTLQLQKGPLGTAASMPSPSETMALKDSTNRITGKRKQPETVYPLTEFCFINRNPAEFTVPEAGNKYMTGYENVKLKENILSRDGTEMVESVHNKRPKKVRFADLKDV